MNNKSFTIAARVISIIFTPFYLPLIGLAMLFIFSYMAMLPWQYKLSVITGVYLFTVLFPSVLIYIYRRYNGWNLIELGNRQRRMVPYAISIICYLVCYYIMRRANIPTFMTRILLASLLIQIVCALINVWWKISTHSAAIGGVAGALVAFSFLFNFNPLWWLCLVIAVAGMVGTSRMILRQHTLSQVVIGFFIGLLCAFITII